MNNHKAYLIACLLVLILCLPEASAQIYQQSLGINVLSIKRVPVGIMNGGAFSFQPATGIFYRKHKDSTTVLRVELDYFGIDRTFFFPVVERVGLADLSYKGLVASIGIEKRLNVCCVQPYVFAQAEVGIGENKTNYFDLKEDFQPHSLFHATLQIAGGLGVIFHMNKRLYVLAEMQVGLQYFFTEVLTDPYNNDEPYPQLPQRSTGLHFVTSPVRAIGLGYRF